jgi:hypothetical protein
MCYLVLEMQDNTPAIKSYNASYKLPQAYTTDVH